MEITISENAAKQLRRFKRITEWDVIDFVDSKLNDEPYQGLVTEAELIDKDDKIIVYVKINSDGTALEVLEVRRYY